MNLLAGMVLPGVDRMSVAELEQFRLSLLLVAVVIHAVNSVVFGLIYGVLLPTLPHDPSAAGLGRAADADALDGRQLRLMGVVDPLAEQGVDWPWFIASQFVFGVVAALTIMRAGKRSPAAGRAAGRHRRRSADADPRRPLGLSSGQGIWYPANLLAGMVLPRLDRMPMDELTQFRADWLAIAVVIHIAMSIGIGLVFGLLLPGSARFPRR